MITLVSNKDSISIKPLEANLKRYAEFEGHRFKLQEQINKAKLNEDTRTMAKMLSQNEKLARIVTVFGHLNPVELNARKERNLSKGLKEEEALNVATESMQQELALVMTEDVRVYNFFSGDGQYPRTANAIKVAIEVIKETADSSYLTPQQKKLLNKPEFWDSVSFEGVAAYADLFLEQYKSD